MKNKDKIRLKELDRRMYNLNANLSALVHIQKLKTLKEAEEFMRVINGEIAKWIKEIRNVYENMEDQTLKQKERKR